MVNEAKNSPAVIMWSIGNEIPGWTSPQALPIEQRLIADIKSIDTTRPVVAGSDRYRSVPAPGSVAEQMLLQARRPRPQLRHRPRRSTGCTPSTRTKFFFESESSSETSTRGYYQDPNLLNTGQNFTPGQDGTRPRMTTTSTTWTMSNEYSLKKDRDRQFFAGQFMWSGFDYIGEPTPYTRVPGEDVVLRRDRHGRLPEGRLLPVQVPVERRARWSTSLPMNWTDYKPGQTVQVWAYANAPTVELFLNGVSLGAKSFDHKTTHRRAPLPRDDRVHGRRQELHAAAPARAATRARTAARASCT